MYIHMYVEYIRIRAGVYCLCETRAGEGNKGRTSTTRVKLPRQSLRFIGEFDASPRACTSYAALIRCISGSKYIGLFGECCGSTLFVRRDWIFSEVTASVGLLMKKSECRLFGSSFRFFGSQRCD